MDSSSNSKALEKIQLEWKGVILSALDNLSLNWVIIGEYVIVMNDKIDATIGGEPYLTRQLWFNMKSSKIISRIWDQTVSVGRAVNVAQFSEACISHFEGRPCIGYPSSIDHHSWQDFVVSQTPVPRKISRTCQKVLKLKRKDSVQSCQECLQLGISLKQEELPDKEVSVPDVNFDGGKQEDGELESVQNESKYAYDRDNRCYTTNDHSNLEEHCQKYSHGPPPPACIL